MKKQLYLASILIVLISTNFIFADDAKLPNVVFILADDLGIGDVKCFGDDRCKIETPNFDRLAREGVKFTDVYASASHCIPTRMAIMTGRYPWRFKPPRPDGPWGFLNPRMHKGQFTIGNLLQTAGYETGYIGKWHLGTLMQTKDGKNQGLKNVDFTKPLTNGPANFGFDFSFILPGSLDMYPYAFVENQNFVGNVTKQRGWSAFNRVGPTAEDFEDYKVLDTFSNQAERFIDRNAKVSKQGKPFFLYLALTAPHTPTSPSPKFSGKSKIGLYGDFVMETDDCIGRVLSALEKNGLVENTLVIATSDHGAAPYAGNIRKATVGQIRDLEKHGHFSSGIYRGYKFSVYEGGLRIPFVARWPKYAKAGSVCDRLVGLNDLLATLAELTNQKLKNNQAPDSISFLSLLRKPDSESPRDNLIMQSTRSFVVRSGKWKLAICPGSGCVGHLGNRPTQKDSWKRALVEFARSPKNNDELKIAPFVQLFDLSKDPSESINLAKKNPEQVAELLEILEKQIRDGRSTPGPMLKNDRNVNYFSGVPKFVWQNSK